MDRYLVSAAIILLFCECGWLLQDLHVISLPGFHQSKIIGEGQVLGQILQTKKEVKRRAVSSLVWEETHTKQNLYAYDSVLTLDQSAAEVNLGQGTKVTLHENTLVTIEPPANGAIDGPVRLHFKEGTMRASFDRTPQNFQAGDFTIEAAAKSDITIRSRGPDQFEVETHAGDVKIVDSQSGAQTQEVKSGQVVEVNAKKIADVHDALAINWKDPAEGTRIYTHDGSATVTLAWEGKADTIVLDDPQSEESKAVAVEGTGNQQSLNLAVGHYVIRLRNEAISTFARNVSVWDAPKIHLIQPLTRQRIRLGSPVDLMWTPNLEVAKFRWQVATDEKFNNVVAQGETAENTKAVENLPLGQYFWRVLGKDDQGFVIPEMYDNTFYIISNPLEAPKLKTPTVKPEDDESTLMWWWDLLLPRAEAQEDMPSEAAAPLAPAQTSPRRLPKHYYALFQWEPVAGADSYNVEISETPDFRNPVIKETAKMPEFKWKDFHLGKYYWRVAAQAGGEMGFFSETAVADLSTIPRGPVVPVSVEENARREARKAEIAAILAGDASPPRPNPAPTPLSPGPKTSSNIVPAPAKLRPAPVPLESKPVTLGWTYDVKAGGHAIYNQFTGGDFTVTQAGVSAGDFRLTITPDRQESLWHLEAEYEQDVLQISNPAGFPFQSTLSLPTFRMTVIKDSPYQWGRSWGFAVQDQNLIFKRTDFESVGVVPMPVAGPVLDWSSHMTKYENDFRLALFVGQAPSLEGGFSHTFIYPISGKFDFTMTVEARLSGGFSIDSSWWLGGTGFFFAGGRW